jgi:hypothetical protein
MKGLDAIVGDLLTMELPDADVYYIWIGRHSLRVYDRIKSGAVVIFGNQVGEIRDAVEKLPNIVKNSFTYLRDTVHMSFNYYSKLK